MSRLLRPSLHWLLVFVPLTIVIERVRPTSHQQIFISACLAIVPLAGLLSHATEQLAARTGDAVGGFLNATFGNAAELIIGIVAIKEGEFVVAKAALIGGIIGNALLVLGSAFFVGGLKHKEQRFNAEGAQTQAATLAIASIALILPAALHSVGGGEALAPAMRRLNIAVAGALIFVYALSLVYSLYTHRDLFTSKGGGGGDSHGHDEKKWPVSVAIGVLLGSSAAIAVMSELLVGSVGEAAAAMGMSDLFVGVIVLATVGGAAELYAACVMAGRNKMDLSVGIALGSSTLIALFVAPVLFFASLVIAPAPFDLAFSPGEVLVVVLTVLIVGAEVSGGRSTWFRGVQLLAVYALMAIAFYMGGEVRKLETSEPAAQGSSEVSPRP